MRVRGLLIFALTATLFCTFGYGQAVEQKSDVGKDNLTKEQRERVIQMLDELIAAADALRLPENRATLYSSVGDLYWKFDEKWSRELFRSAAGELTGYYSEIAREPRDPSGMYNSQMNDPNDRRAAVMSLIGRRDPALALDLLLQTRPAKLAEAMARARQTGTILAAGTSIDMERYSVQQETALLQQFAMRAAENDPDKMTALIKDSLAKGVYNVMTLLQKLYIMDPKKATELGGDLIKKLVDSDMSKSQADMSVAFSFLQNATRSSAPTGSSASLGPVQAAASNFASANKRFEFTDAQIKDLANKLANSLTQPAASSIAPTVLRSAMPVLEKIIPERAAELKQKQAESQRSMPAEQRSRQDLQKVMDPNVTPEDILAQLAKMPDGPIKSQSYSLLEYRIGQITDEARARKLIDQIPDEKVRASAQEKFDAAKIARTAAAGKLDDAHQTISFLTNKRERMAKLVALAVQYFRKGGEANVESANNIMKEARVLVRDLPSDGDEINDLMEVVKGYTVIEPETAFRMFEPVVDLLNEYVQAAAVLNKYEKRGQDFRNGELELSMNQFQRGGGSLTFRYLPQIQALGKADLERMDQISARLQRPDYRASVRLSILRGFLTDSERPATPTQP